MSSISTNFPFFALPNELVLEILNFAAAETPAMCLTLCQVSSWVRHLAMPYLLSMVIVGPSMTDSLFGYGVGSGVDELFLRYLSRPPLLPLTPTFNHASLVRSLWMPHDLGVNLTEIFRRCDNLKCLALSDVAFTVLTMVTSVIEGRTFPGADSNIHTRDLYVTVMSTMSCPEDLWLRIVPRYGERIVTLSPIFNMVTHLRLWLALPYARQLELAHFTRLTHLAIRLTIFMEDLLPALECVLAAPHLKVLVIEFDPEVIAQQSLAAFETWLFALRKTDKRVYFASFSLCSFQAEWMEEAEGGESIWKRASDETLEREAHFSEGKQRSRRLLTRPWEIRQFMKLDESIRNRSIAVV